jgi:2Fe-2S ferredoxin
MAKLVKITFQPLGKTVEVDLDTMPYKEHGKPASFLDIALNHGIHLEHACGGTAPAPLATSGCRRAPSC